MQKRKEEMVQKLMKNYYEILEVNPKASKEVIEKAYKVLVKKYHPDLYPGEKQRYAENKIKDINEAYNVLSDEFLKEQYDNEIKRQESQRKGNIDTQQSRQTVNTNENRPTKEKETSWQETKKRQKVGTLSSTIELTKELIHDLARSKEKRQKLKEMTQKDILAIILTIIVVILIGIVLWFIPLTNGWMRELLFENPVFNWIGKLFSK